MSVVLPQMIRVGVGGAARRGALRRADALRAEGIAARALFKPEHGGWVIVVYGALRERPGMTQPP